MLPVTRENVKKVADQVLAAGGTKLDIDFALYQAMNVMMGEGGKGPWQQGWPDCRYCDASGGGGHAGLCPAGYDDGPAPGNVPEEAFTVMRTLFTGLRRAGFTVTEASAVVAAVLAAQSPQEGA